MAAKKRKQKGAAEPKRAPRKLRADVSLKVEHVPELADTRYKMYRAKIVGSNGSINIGSFLATNEKHALAKARAAVRAAIR